MKKAISILLAAAMGAAALTGCSKSSGSASSGNTPLVLNEVAHSIFYAPNTRPLSWAILRMKAST